METIIERLAAAAGRYRGSGDGAESGPFSATIDVRAALDGLGVEIEYEAIGPDGERLHVERTMLTFNMISGEPTLYVLCDELHGMAQLAQVSESTFSNGAGREGFELQIDIELDGETLDYVWSWGPPQIDLAEQSRAVVHRAG